MPNYMNNNCDCNRSSDCTVFNGKSVDININSCDCEIRADVVLSEYKAVRLWGRVLNCDGEPVENALIKLVKVEYNCNHECYVGVAHTISDCNGFYQFELCNYDNKSRYKLLVNKATYGSDTILPIEFNECKPCEEPDICSADYSNPQNSNLKYNENYNENYDERYKENKCYECENKCNKYESNYAYKDPKYYYSNKH